MTWGSNGLFAGRLRGDPKFRVILGEVHKLPVWDLKVWNHVCLILDSVTAKILTVMNGDTILHEHLKVDLSLLDQNISLLGLDNKGGYTHSLFGRITDVNMWSRSMTEEDAVAWTMCRMREGGDLVDWRTATWEARGLQEVHVEREEVCKERQHRLLVSNIRRDFGGTLHLARTLGGTMAIAGSHGHAEEIIQALEPVNKYATLFSQDSQTGRRRASGSIYIHRRN